VILFCNGFSVLLAHLQNASLTVSVGNRVRSGNAIGKLGNSGNTTEPHLHIHAVRGRVTEQDEIAGTAIGVLIEFGSRYLIRGDRFTIR